MKIGKVSRIYSLRYQCLKYQKLTAYVMTMKILKTGTAQIITIIIMKHNHFV